MVNLCEVCEAELPCAQFGRSLGVCANGIDSGWWFVRKVVGHERTARGKRSRNPTNKRRGLSQALPQAVAGFTSIRRASPPLHTISLRHPRSRLSGQSTHCERSFVMSRRTMGTGMRCEREREMAAMEHHNADHKGYGGRQIHVEM